MHKNRVHNLNQGMVDVWEPIWPLWRLLKTRDGHGEVRGRCSVRLFIVENTKSNRVISFSTLTSSVGSRCYICYSEERSNKVFVK